MVQYSVHHVCVCVVCVCRWMAVYTYTRIADLVFRLIVQDSSLMNNSMYTYIN